jgi:enoyl-CoA hydratase/carnithine racemase
MVSLRPTAHLLGACPWISLTTNRGSYGPRSCGERSRTNLLSVQPQPLPAHIANEWGVVAKVVPDGQPVRRARELAALYLAQCVFGRDSIVKSHYAVMSDGNLSGLI